MTDGFVARSRRGGRPVADRFEDLIVGIRRPFELLIDTWGIRVTGTSGIAAPWAEIADVYILNEGRTRTLVYQLTPEAAAQRGKTGTWHAGRWHERTLLYAVQPGVKTHYLDRDEREVLAAVEHFSGGRFPTAERMWNGRKPDSVRRN